jgi:hypothetical protein
VPPPYPTVEPPCPNPALLLEPEPFSTDRLAAEAVPLGRPLVGMSVREPGKAASGMHEGGYHDLLAATPA